MAVPKPKISVLMSVFDRADYLRASIDSVLGQTDVQFELILIDDGAGKKEKAILQDYRADSRVLVIEQENQGLTQALINGCQQASGEYIARLDVGDRMLDGRLHRQLHILDTMPDCAIVASWVQMITEEGFDLYTVAYSSQELNSGLHASDIVGLKTPAHFSVMFRKSNYMQCGGYRSEFYFAQDVDLWLRLIKTGSIEVVEDVLTQSIFSSGGISGQYRPQQQQLASLAVQLANTDSAQPECARLLSQAKTVRPVPGADKASPNEKTQGDYFIARCLSQSQPDAALTYYRKVLVQDRWHIRAYLGLIEAKLRRCFLS